MKHTILSWLIAIGLFLLVLWAAERSKTRHHDRAHESADEGYPYNWP